jgi:hypothetical protein
MDVRRGVISSLHIGHVIGYNIYKRIGSLEAQNLGKEVEFI